MKINKPKNINGFQLLKELNADGINATYIREEEEGILTLDIEPEYEDKAKKIISNHNGIDQAIIESAAKAALLAKLGITEEEAKLLLS